MPRRPPPIPELHATPEMMAECIALALEFCRSSPVILHWIKQEREMSDSEIDSLRERVADLERWSARVEQAMSAMAQDAAAGIVAEHEKQPAPAPTVAEAALAEAREQLAAERRAREEAEERVMILDNEAMNLDADMSVLRERGEALARAAEKLLRILEHGGLTEPPQNHICGDPNSPCDSECQGRAFDSIAVHEYATASAAWREIAPAAPEKEKDNG